MRHELPGDEIVLVLASSVAGVGTEVLIGSSPATSAAAATVPVLADLGVRAISAIRHHFDQGVADVLAAVDLADPGLGIFGERPADYDERIELLRRVLNAGGRSTMTAKIRALQRILIDGLAVDGRLGEALLLAAAIEMLEAPHLAVLRRLRDEPKPPLDVASLQVWQPLRGWETDHIARKVAGLAGIADGVVAGLTGRGLLRDVGGIPYPGGVGPAVWEMTAFGRRCLSLLEDPRDP